MSWVTTSRGQFFYLQYGATGPIVYLLHGLSAKCQDWESIPLELAKVGFKVYAFDMKGHGQSDHPSTGYTPEDLARDVEACADELGHDQVHLVGHSTGGRNGLFFATMFASKTLTLTILDQTLSADPKSWEKLQETYLSYPVPFANETSLDQFLMEKYPNRERRRHFEKGQFIQNPAGQWVWNFSLKAVLEIQKWGRAQDLHWLLKRVSCPILFIKAADSPYVSPPECEKISALLKESSCFTVIEKAGHGVFRDNPQSFLRNLIPFLQM